jgi:hypothetical protein
MDADVVISNIHICIRAVIVIIKRGYYLLSAYEVMSILDY